MYVYMRMYMHRHVLVCVYVCMLYVYALFPVESFQIFFGEIYGLCMLCMFVCMQAYALFLMVSNGAKKRSQCVNYV